MAIPISVRMTLEEFIQQFDEAPFELIDGEKIPLRPSVFGPGSVANTLARLLIQYVAPRGLGEVYVETVFVSVIPEDHQWVTGSRVPDVMFIRTEKLAAYKKANPDWAEKPLVLLPDLAIGVVSPTDRFTNVHRKVNKYIEDGVLTVWVIDATQQTAIIYTAGSNQQTRLSSEDMLTGGEVLPGFEVKLAELFK